MYDNEDKKWLYGKFSDAGLNIGSYEDFEKSLQNDDDKKWYHEKATNMGLNVGSYDDFNSLFGVPAAPQTNQVDDVTAQRNRDFAHQYEYAQDKVVDPRLSDSEKRQYVDFVDNYADRYEQIRGQYGRTEAPAPETQQTFRAGQRYESQANGDLPQLLKDAGLTAKDVTFQWGGGQSGAGYYTLTPEQADAVNKVHEDVERYKKMFNPQLIYGEPVMFNDNPNPEKPERNFFKGAIQAGASGIGSIMNAVGESINSARISRMGKEADAYLRKDAYAEFERRIRENEPLFRNDQTPSYATRLGMTKQERKDSDRKQEIDWLINLLRDRAIARGEDPAEAVRKALDPENNKDEVSALIETGTGIIEDNQKPLAGAAKVGALFPMMATTAGSIALAATGHPEAAKSLGEATLSMFATSSAGSAMKQARDAGATNEQTLAAGLASGAIMYAFAKIPLGRYIRQSASSAAAKTVTDIVGRDASREIEVLLQDAAKRGFITEANAKYLLSQWAGNVAHSTASFAAMSGLEAVVPLIYESPDNYPVLSNVLNATVSGAEDGLIMGVLMGSVSSGVDLYRRNQRWQKQGSAYLAEVQSNGRDVHAILDPETKTWRPILASDTPSKMSFAEIISYNKDQKTGGISGDLVVIQAEDGNIYLADPSIIKVAREFGYKKAAEESKKAYRDAGYDAGEAAETQEQKTDIRVDRDYQVAKAAKEAGEGGTTETTQLDLERANAAMEGRRDAVLNRMTQQIGRPFWKGDAGAETVDVITLSDGGDVFVVAEDEKGIAYVDKDGNPGMIDNDSEKIARRYQQSLNEYLDAQVSSEDQIAEQERMSAEQADNIAALQERVQRDGQINLGTTEEPVLGKVVGVNPNLDGGVTVQVEGEANPRFLNWKQVSTTVDLPFEPKSNEDLVNDRLKVNDTISSYNEKIPQDADLQVQMEDGETAIYKFKDAELVDGEIVIHAEDPESKAIVDLVPETVTNLESLMSKPNPTVDVAEAPAPVAAEAVVASEAFSDPVANELGIDKRYAFTTDTGEVVVDGRALWNDNPELWAEWNDRNPNRGISTQEYLADKQQKIHDEARAALEAYKNEWKGNQDPNVLRVLKEELDRKVERTQRVDALVKRYDEAEAAAKRAEEESTIVRKIFPDAELDPATRHEVAEAYPALERIQKLEGLSIIQELGEALSRTAAGESLTPTEATMRMFSEAAKTPGMLARLMEQYAELAERFDADTVAEKQDILRNILAENNITIENGTIGTDQSGVSADASVRADASGEGEVGPAADTAGSGGAAPVQGARNPAAVRQAIIDNAQQRLDDWNARMQAAATDEERQALLQEKVGILQEMADGLGIPITVTTDGQLDAQYLADGAPQSTVDYVRQGIVDARQNGERPRAFYDPDVDRSYMLADYITTAMDGVTAAVHENKHLENTRTGAVKESLKTGVTTLEMANAVYNLTRSHAYDNAGREKLADEVFANAAELAELYGVEALPQKLREAGITNEKFINFVQKNIRDGRSQSSGRTQGSERNPLQYRNGRGSGQQNGRDSRRGSAEVGGRNGAEEGGAPASGGGEAAESGLDTPDENGVTPAQKQEITAAVGGEMENGPATRLSVTAIAEGAGLEAFGSDEEGNVVFTGPDGTRFTGKDTITADYLKNLPNTVMGYMMADAKQLGTITDAQADNIWQKYADMLNAFLQKGLAENGGIETLSGQWQWVAETVYKTVASNSDDQYSYSLDITRVCKKNEAVIKTIAEMQRRLGYGVTPGQIMDIYLASEREGYQVPCPVCYVFSRYIRNGQYATIMLNGQRKYGKRLKDPRTLTDAEKKKEIRYWRQQLEKQQKNNEKHDAVITKAKEDIQTILDKVDKLGLRLLSGNLDKAEERRIKQEISALDARYRKALNVVSQAGLDGWITNFAVHETKNGWELYDDSYQGFPEEMALDLRETATVLREYPAIQRYRNSRGAAAGKEITFEANNDIGEVPMMLGVPKTKLKTAPNYYKLAVQAKDEKTRNKMLKEARKRLDKAHTYAQQQSLRGGQRMWSWSDNIERLSPDVFVNLLQMEILGGALQSYSKQLEGINLVARMGGYVNGSLMGKGIGYREVEESEIERVGDQLFMKDGDLILSDGTVIKAPVYESEGKYYTLEFDDVVGIDAYGKKVDGKHYKGLFELNHTLDKAGNILVGMDDIHIRAAMADGRVFFIIPWHASGGSVHLLRQMLSYLGVDLKAFNPKDYTNVQEEKRSEDVSEFLAAFWEAHKNETDFRVGIAGGIPSGQDGKLSPQQVHYKELRDAILKGEDLSGEWLAEIEGDEFLSQLRRKVAEAVDIGEMTAGDTKFIYPYEYWDESSTYDTADVNGARYLEYCRRLGYKPKFVGKLDGSTEDFGNFADDKGYWKLLIDRRMYDTQGNFQDLTPVSSEGFSPDLVDPEKTAQEFQVTRVADDNAAKKVADRVIEREESRPGGVAKVNYGTTLDKAVAEYEKELAKTPEDYTPAQRAVIDRFLGGLEEDFGSGPIWSFVGEKGAAELDKASNATVRMHNRDIAIAMEEIDADPLAIKMATGWERGADGAWRYETSDIKVSRDKISTMKTGDSIRLGDLVEPGSGPLIAYPELADFTVKIAPKKENFYGQLKFDDKQILLNLGSMSDEYSDYVSDTGRTDHTIQQYLAARASSTMSHEIQHAIQFLEGFAIGDNVAVKESTPVIARLRKDNPTVMRMVDMFGGTPVRRLHQMGRGTIAKVLKGENASRTGFDKLDARRKAIAKDLAADLDKMTDSAFRLLATDMAKVMKVAREEAKEMYHRSAGEVESRNVQRRMSMAPEQRETTLAETTEDVPRSEQVVRRSSKSQQDVRFSVSNERNDIFISNAEKAAQEIKMEKATPEQWLKMLEKSGGLKAGEDKWIGLSDWLKEQKGTVTKQQVLDYINEHKIQIEEVNYAEESEDAYDKALDSYREEFQNFVEEGKAMGFTTDAVYGFDEDEEDENRETRNAYDYAYYKMVDIYGDDFEMAFEREGDSLAPRLEPWEEDYSDAAKYFLRQRMGAEAANPINSTRMQYTTEGLGDYREIALTVPTIEPWNEEDRIHFGDAGEGRAIAWIRFGDAVVGLNKKALVIDEIQSKRHQEAREQGGYKDDAALKKAIARRDAAKEEYDKYHNALLDKYGNYNTMRVNITPEENAESQRLYHVYSEAQNAVELNGFDPMEDEEYRRMREEMEALDNNEEFARLRKEWTEITGRRRIFNGIEDIRVYVDEDGKRDFDVFNGTRTIRIIIDDNREITSCRVKSLIGKNLNDVFGRDVADRLMSADNGTMFTQQSFPSVQKDLERRDEIDDALAPYQQRVADLSDMMYRRKTELAEAFNRAHRSRVPAAPFEKNWHELAFKRMLRLAAEEGYDYVAWTTGEQQAERYNIGNIVETIDVSPWGQDKNGYNLDEEIGANGRSVLLDIKNQDRSIALTVDKEGNVIDTPDNEFRNTNLSEIVGKELAIRILSVDGRERFGGDNLRIGGEGMKGFYDDILPRFVNKYGKKWGVKVEDIQLYDLGEGPLTMHSIPVTKEMKESVMQGQPMFSVIKENTQKSIDDTVADAMPHRKEAMRRQKVVEKAQNRLDRTRRQKEEIANFEKDFKRDLHLAFVSGNQGLITLKNGTRVAKSFVDFGPVKGALEFVADIPGVPINRRAPIEMDSSNLRKHASASYVSNHPFTEEEVADILPHLYNPVAVFNDPMNGGVFILTDLYVTRDGKQYPFAVGMKNVDDKYGRERNVIATIYPMVPDGNNAPGDTFAERTLTRFRNGSCLWADIKKAAGWEAMHGIDIRTPYRFSQGDIAKVANNFKNQQISEEFLQENLENEQNSLQEEMALGNFKARIKPGIASYVEEAAREYGLDDLSVRNVDIAEDAIRVTYATEEDSATLDEIFGGETLTVNGKEMPVVLEKEDAVDDPKLAEEAQTRFSVVTEEAQIRELENDIAPEPAYRAAQFVPDPNGDWEFDLGDGRGMQKGFLYPPMSAQTDKGEWRDPIRREQWEKSDENPEKAIRKTNKKGEERWVFRLHKGNGKYVDAAYNPYLHSSDTMLNDQFAEAQSRGNLVVLEVALTNGELNGDSPYHAEKAKDSVGKHDWKAGPIQAQLTGTRTVNLTQYDKPMRIVPVSEVADNVAEMIKGQVDLMPSNVVWPQLRAELEKRGVQFIETDNQGKILDGEHKGEYYIKVYNKKKGNKTRFSTVSDEQSEKLFAAAKERFGTTRDIREAGYVLPDGTMLDFSGRHWTSGGDNSWLNGLRQVDHREIGDLEFERDGNTPSGLETDMSDFIRRGAIRIDASGSINLATKPTAAQESVLRRLMQSSRGMVWVDFGDGSTSDHSVSYEGINPERVINDIRRYFNEGVKPESRTMFSVVSAEQDKEYMDAVESGDMEKAQRMVRDAVKRAMPDTKVVDEDGNPRVMFHGTITAGFNVFKGREGGDSIGWFTSSKMDADSYGGNADGKLYDPQEKPSDEVLRAGDFRLNDEMVFDSQKDLDDFRNAHPEIDSYISEKDLADAMFEVETDAEEDALRKREEASKIIREDYYKYEREHLTTSTVGDLLDNPDVYSTQDFKRAWYAIDRNANFDDLDGLDPAGQKDALAESLRDYVENEDDPDGTRAISFETRVPRGGEGVKANDTNRRTYAAYINLENPLTVDAKGKHSELESRDIYEAVDYALSNDRYDGVLIKNWRVGRYQRLGDVAIPKESSQIKLANPATYDDNGNLILLSQRFNRENNDIRFSIRQSEQRRRDEIARVEKDGLGAVIGQQNVAPLMRSVYQAIPKDILGPVVDKAIADGLNIRGAMNEYLHGLAANGTENDETGLLFALYDQIRAMSGNPDLTDGDIRYMIWKSTGESGDDILSQASDIAMKNRWNVGREEPAYSVRKQDLTEVVEDAQEKLNEKLSDAAEDLAEAKDAVPHLKDVLNPVVAAMSAQKEYDRATADGIIDFAKQVLKNGGISTLSTREFNRLLGNIKASIGKSPKSVVKYSDELLDKLIDHMVKDELAKFEKLVNIKDVTTNQSGVAAIGSLDVSGQIMMRAMRDYMLRPQKEINERIAEIENKFESTDEKVRADALAEYEGLKLASDYQRDLAENIKEGNDLENELDEAKDAKRSGDFSAKDYAEFAKVTQQAIRENKIARVDYYRDFSERLSELQKGSKVRARAFREAEKQRVENIHHIANLDLQGTPNKEHLEPGWKSRVLNSTGIQFFLKPLATFDQMLRLLGRSTVTGEGYLYNHFGRGWIDAREKELVGKEEAMAELDTEVQDVFDDPDMKWAKLYDKERKMPGATVYFFDGGEKVAHDLTPGNLLYIYMANKMIDGKMKLRKMGISEDDVTKIKESLDPKFVELADWLQEEFLPKRRAKYNAVHEEMFGAPMAAIDDYFPLKILSNARVENIDLADDPNASGLSSTTTGSIVKRQKNSLALDLLNTDAFSLAVEHIEEMENWAAFAPFRKDMNTLLSYKRFRNQVQNMDTVYGSGKDLWNNFKDVASIATGNYRPKVGKRNIDTIALNVAKGVTGAKIAFRVGTALKQVLSAPAFLSDARIDLLAKNLATAPLAWNWCMENLPVFRERWNSRFAGDTRLMQTESDWDLWKNKVVKEAGKYGMSPNAFVDALTVAVGAKSMYETKYQRYIEAGYPEEKADKMAKQDATILYNQTQQSSEAMFTSAMQLDRTLGAVLFTVFRNSSMGYSRQTHDALRTYGRMMKPGYRDRAIERATRQRMEDGIGEDEARDYAEKEYDRQRWRSAARIGIFAFLLPLAWNYGIGDLLYVLFGKDEKEKKKIHHDALVHTLAGPVEGLTGGSVISSAWGTYSSTGKTANIGLAELPIESDIDKIVSMIDYDEPAAVAEVINLIVQSGIGLNPQTFTDAVVATIDAFNGDLGAAKEFAIWLMRVNQLPQPSVERFLLDEINMAPDEMKAARVEELAARYAEYKLNKAAPLNRWMYDDGLEAKRRKSYQTKFKNKVKERNKLHEEKNKAE